jgi:hypothetical protein
MTKAEQNRVPANARNKSITLLTQDEFTASNIAHVG